MKIHKMAHNIPSKEKQNNLYNPFLDLPERLEVAEVLPEATLTFRAFNLSLLKLDIRSKALFTRTLSAAEAGVAGIDSIKAHRAEEKLEFVASSCILF